MSQKLYEYIFYYDKEFNRYDTPFIAWHHADVKSECRFYYYDHILKDSPWKVEPVKTLDQLYKERAQEIRDNYEYVILCYSGGNDSTAMLESFYYNNIHIDEIVMVGSFSQDTSKEIDENHNKDLYDNAFPLIKKLNLPNTKITTIDYTELFRDINQFTLVQTYGNDYIRHVGTHKSPHNLFWHDFRKFVGKQNNKKTAWLMGIDKVELGYDSITPRGAIGPHVFFKDITINSYGMNHIDENFERINFYCDPRSDIAISIQIKQAHILHNVVKINLANRRSRSDVEHSFINRFVKYKLFYNLKNPLMYQSKKSSNFFFSDRDMYMFSKKDSDIFKIHKENISKRSDYFKQSPCYLTRKYYIE
jgi:hypothetical protein